MPSAQETDRVYPTAHRDCIGLQNLRSCTQYHLQNWCP